MMRCTLVVVAVAFLAGGLVGCQHPKMTMDEMLTPPPRPAELDQLDALIGTWEGDWEITMKGEDKPMTGHGTDTMAWASDKWAVIERGDGMMGDHKMVGTGLWTWDAKSKVFRYTGADNYGMLMTGTGKYDAKTDTWHFKGTTRDTVHGHKTVGEGTFTMPDPDTMEWNWTEWDALHLTKFMEMKGTSHRRK